MSQGCPVECGLEMLMFNSPFGYIVVVWLLSHVQLVGTPGTAACQAFCPPVSPRVCSQSCPLSQKCYLTISSSAILSSFCLQSFPALRSFPMSCLFSLATLCHLKKSEKKSIEGYEIYIIQLFFPKI